MIEQWALAFALTQAIEAPLYFRASRSWPTALLASVWTHPALWLLFRPVEALVGYAATWWLLEACAVLVEAGWLHHRRVPRALRLSALVNATSALAGVVAQAAWGWP